MGGMTEPSTGAGESAGMVSDLIITNEAVVLPGDYVIRVRRCENCMGEGGICLTTHKETCQTCHGTGRLGEIQVWPEAYAAIERRRGRRTDE